MWNFKNNYNYYSINMEPMNDISKFDSHQVFDKNIFFKR